MSIDLNHVKYLSFDTLDSTLLEAKRYWSKPSSPKVPTVIVANEQYAGVGRDGRRWQSPRGGLWMTMVWPTEVEIDFYQPLPLIAGLSLIYTLEELFQFSTKIKWPNDVLFQNRKLAGILCKTQIGRAHV